MFTFSRDKERISPGIFLRYAMAVALTMGAMIIYIYPSIRATSMMYEYSMESKKLAELKERNKTLKLQLQT
ncbi:MAG: hypothetical protein OEV92_13775, partial [Nitrospinota bacterium]|nr:hypothetical protein [Nitrospinota bacterium]